VLLVAAKAPTQLGLLRASPQAPKVLWTPFDAGR